MNTELTRDSINTVEDSHKKEFNNDNLIYSQAEDERDR